MGFPSKESGAGSSGVLSSQWTQSAVVAQTMNLDGIGNIKASAINASTDVMAYRNENTFNPDQYAQVTIRGGLSSGNNYAEVLVRCSGSGGSFAGYNFNTDGVTGATHTVLQKWSAGSASALTNFATTFTTGDVMKISVVGSVISCYKNGALLGTFTDASLTTGAPGCGVFNGAANNVLLQNFEGGNVAEAYSVATRRPFPNAAGPYDRLGFLKRSDYAYPTTAVSGAFTLTPDVGSLILDGFAPTIGTPITVLPGLGSLVLTGFSPTFPTTLTPGFGQLILTGFAPTIGVPVTVVPGFGSLILTGFAPQFPRTIVPGFGQLILSGFAPTFPQTLLPGVGSLVLSGFAPSFSFVAGSFTLQPGVGSLVLTGFAPTLGRPITVVPGLGALTLTGFAPVLGVPITVRTGLGQLTLAGFGPTFTFTLLQIARAIAQSAGTDSIASRSQSSGTLIQNSGIITINTGDSQTIQIITGNSGVISLDSDG